MKSLNSLLQVDTANTDTSETEGPEKERMELETMLPICPSVRMDETNLEQHDDQDEPPSAQALAHADPVKTRQALPAEESSTVSISNIF